MNRMDNSQLLVVATSFVGIAASLFRAKIAVKAFMYPEKKNAIPNYHIEWYLHQAWIHFIGSLVGWASLLYILVHSNHNKGIGIETIILFLLATMGIMGFLPTLLWNVTWSVNEFVGIVKKKI